MQTYNQLEICNKLIFEYSTAFHTELQAIFIIAKSSLRLEDNPQLIFTIRHHSRLMLITHCISLYLRVLMIFFYDPVS